MEKTPFYILTPCVKGSLLEQTQDIYRQLQAIIAQSSLSLQALLQARLYVSDATNQCPLLRSTQLVKALEPTGVLTYIEQPPLLGTKIALLLAFVQGKVTEREVHQLADGYVAIIRSNSLTYIMQTVRLSTDVKDEDAEKQTLHAFESHIAQLRARGMNLKEHCHRTWIYVRDIDRHYASVVKARNELFAREELTADTHFIASTGIGGACEHAEALVSIDFFSVSGLDSDKVGYLHAPSYLNSTHEYGVAFERGTWIDLPNERLFIVSGTASIDATGQCVHRGDVLTQAGHLFLNIEKLLESGGGALSDVAYFIVYLRDVSDYVAVQSYMRLRFPHIPMLITEARVCRPEWLIEVECMATKKIYK